MAKRLASGKARVGEQRNQNQILTGSVTFTGSVVVDLGRVIKKKANVVRSTIDFHVMALNFQDTGGAATVHRLASVNNNDGTFTIYASKETGVAGTYATATNACTVRWSALVVS